MTGYTSNLQGGALDRWYADVSQERAQFESDSNVIGPIKGQTAKCAEITCLDNKPFPCLADNRLRTVR